jgi:hypothetical protein
LCRIFFYFCFRFYKVHFAFKIYRKRRFCVLIYGKGYISGPYK